MRTAAAWLLAVAAASLPAATAAAIDRAALIGLAPSVVKIEAVAADGRLQLGSGVVVAEATVATNCHVTRRAARVWVVKAGARWEAPRESRDEAHDLCLLRVPGLAGDAATPAVTLADGATLKVGQPLMAIGYTGGVGLQLSDGEIVALHAHDGAQVIRSSNGFSSGASGGGLFTADGRLAGLLTFRLRGGAAHYFSMPADWLRERLHDDSSFVALQPHERPAFWELPPPAQPYFLQAASLEQTGDWPRLQALGERWNRERPGDAEAAYTLAVAREGLGQEAEAEGALRESLARDPSYLRGWQRLASLQRRLGRIGEMQQTLDALGRLDAELARTLTIELDRWR